MRGLGDQIGQRSIGWACAMVALFALACPTQAAPTNAWGNARILYFEQFETKIDPRPALAGKQSNTRQLKFNAYGRELELTLEPNALLDATASEHSSTVRLYRGELSGIAGSWARIATRESEIHGLIWDGKQLLVIEPTEAVRDSLVPPLDARTSKTILFRLSDTILDTGAALCSADTPTAATALDSYQSMRRELSELKGTPALAQATSAALRLQLSAIGDALFRAQFDSDGAAIDQMLLRLNNVDGIFAAELGVQIQVPTTLVYNPSNDPLPSTTVATDLLRQLAAVRAKTSQLKSRGLTHLFTGRDLDGATVGIGYIDAVCNTEFGVGLTEIRGRGAWLESLITAHEIGHNFGAVHDGEDQCNAVPPNQFLMSPTVHSAHATFSACSKTRMMERMRAASCISPLPPADLSIAADLGTVHEGIGRLFEWKLAVTNAGGRLSSGGRIEVLVPSTLRIEDAWIAGGTCTSGAGAVDCELGGIAGGATRTLNLTLKGLTTSTNEISARVIALSEAQTSNNSGLGSIEIDRQLDLSIALQAPSTIATGEAFTTSFALSNLAPEAASSVAVVFTLPPGTIATALNVSNGSCDSSTARCTIPTLDAGALVTGALTMVAQAPGPIDISARVSAAAFDPNAPNDVASVSINVSGAAATTSGAGTVAPSRGGGGAIALPLLLGLLGLACARRR